MDDVDDWEKYFDHVLKKVVEARKANVPPATCHLLIEDLLKITELGMDKTYLEYLANWKYQEVTGGTIQDLFPRKELDNNKKSEYPLDLFSEQSEHD
jgi:hypothetical protein